MSQLKLGRLPHDPTRPRLRLSAFFRAPEPPSSADYYSKVPVDQWGMLGNDIYGDCVFACNGHLVEQQTALGQGQMAPVTTEETLDEYSRVTGFNPDDPSTDQGAQVQDGLSDLQKNGLAGRKVAAFAAADIANMAEVQSAVAEFGAVDIGFNVPQSAMDQFEAGQPWTPVKNDGGIVGGHCVLVVGYDANWLYVVTWGAIQKMSYSFWAAYVEEAWVVIDQDWVSSVTGKDPEGADMAAFGAQYEALTGQPSPFGPSPTPVPPGPSPVPPPPGPAPAPSLWDRLVAWLLSLFGF